MTSNNNDEIIVASKCFCGRNLYSVKSNVSTCGSSDCDLLANKFGTVSNWLVSNVDEMGKDSDEIVFSKIESKVVKFLSSKADEGVSQKEIALETGLAKSTISKTLLRLEKQSIVVKRTDFFSKGKEIAKYFLE